MKRILTLASLALCLFAATGCKPATTATPPLAPGYSTQADETIGRSLAAARGYYQQIQADVTAGTYKPTAAELTAYNSFGQTLNTAEAAYLAFHNGTGTIQAAQTAANQLATQQAALQASVGVKQP